MDVDGRGGRWNWWGLDRGEGEMGGGPDSSSGCFGLGFRGDLRRERVQGRFLGGSAGWRDGDGGGAKEGEGVGDALERRDWEGEARWRWRRRHRRAVRRVSRM